MSTLELTAETRPDAYVLRPRGEADFATIDRLRDAFAAGVECDSPSVVVDLTALDFLDSTVVALLVRVRRELAARGRELTVVAGSPPARLMLELTGVADRLRIVESLDDAAV